MQRQQQRQKQMRGSLHYGGKCVASGRDDDSLWLVMERACNGKGKSKCGDLSTTAASAPPPVEMTVLWVGCGEHATATAATAKAKANAAVSPLRRQARRLGRDDDSLWLVMERTGNGNSEGKRTTPATQQRSAWLFVAEGDDGVDFGGAVGGEPGGDQGDEGDRQGGGDEGEGVGRAEAEELRLDGAGGG